MSSNGEKINEEQINSEPIKEEQINKERLNEEQFNKEQINGVGPEEYDDAQMHESMSGTIHTDVTLEADQGMEDLAEEEGDLDEKDTDCHEDDGQTERGEGGGDDDPIDEEDIGKPDEVLLVPTNGEAVDIKEEPSQPQGGNEEVNAFSGKYQKIKTRHVMDDASLISKFYYHWLNFAFYKAWKHGLKPDDLFPCSPHESASLNHNRFSQLWNEELALRGPKNASLGLVVFRFLLFRVIAGSLTMLMGLAVSLFSSAYIVRRLLEYIQQTESDTLYGMLWVLGLLLCQLTQVTLLSYQFYLNTRTGTKLRAAVVSTIYRRAISVRTLKGKSAGEIINLCTNDGQRLYEMGLYGPSLLCGPPIAVAGIIYTYFLIGPAALFGTGIFFMFYPITMGMAKLVAYFRRQAIQITDKRVRLMNEVISSIKLIKMYAWEMPFSKKIFNMRGEEQRALQKGGYMQSFSTMTLPLVPVLAAMLTLVLHTALGNNLTPAQAFSYISCLTAMRLILVMTPMGVKAVSESVVAFPRIKELLLMEDVKPFTDKPSSSNLALEIVKATFAWDKEQAVIAADGKGLASKDTKNGDVKMKKDAGAEQEEGEESAIPLVEGGETKDEENEIVKTLFDVDLKIEKDSLVGICGSVGSGKSSLINAILSHMIMVDGSVAVDGTFAYVPQQACILNTTLRENILFGLEFDEDRYVDVVEACGLAPDLEILANGDLTEIGERGINLSGGQKQRISMARAVYSQRDIYLLDDPLSAVDAHVGQHIFDNVIKKLLKGKAVLFVTHQLQFLSQCNRVLFMKSGRISADGAHNTLMKSDPEYNALLQNFMQEQEMKRASVHSSKDGGRGRALSSISLTSLDSRQRSESFRTLTQSFRARSNQMLRHASTRSTHSIPEQTPLPIQEAETNKIKQAADDQTDGSEYPPVFESREDIRKENSDGENEESEEEYKEDGEDECDDDEDESVVYDGKLNQPEAIETKVKPSKTYLAYMKSAGGVVVSLLVILIFLISQALATFSSFWLSHWLEQGNGTKIDVNASTIGKDYDPYLHMNVSDNPRLRFYQLVYVASVLGCILFGFLRAGVYVKTTLRASSNFHNKVFLNIIHSPMSFFDVTPSGQILNRFSKDLDEADIRLPFVMESFLQNGIFVLFNLLTVIYIFPWFLVGVVVVVIFFTGLNRFYRPGLRNIKMLDNTLRSPWFSHVTTTMHSLSTIHAYEKTDEFIQKFEKQLDKHSVPMMLFMLANRWLATRFDVMTSLLGCLTATSIVLSHGSIPPGLAGLALTFTMQFLGIFQFTLRLAAEVEARFTSVQRIIDYTKLPREVAPTIAGQEPPENWPDHGRITFQRVKLRYRENLPLVLKGVTFYVKPREKIGIVGRTGSGKSSLGVALYRLAEPCGGSMFIDKRDICKMGLRDLRSKISIIPQDPVLFIGTVRYNLDPFDEHSDESIWRALERTHMKDTISKLDQQLMAPVIENGENFSVGERQLMCMARALLRNSKILFLDEATAAIDSETDTLIQATIREAFRDCTMLTIAHRLNTIVDSHRILVMDDGKIAEFDRPSALMNKPNSIFKSMMEAVAAQKELAEVFGSANSLQVPSPF
ncbi:multidrug resistance-associated protein 5-like isoform X1 [Lytechinus variegatus]|uniref:multidrug resistance-associated protein 5-like isoform X1 n=1 Tax=Lytechinus variegatus TaxID=7654 RepID=UPI001BB22CA9|nr:multidrug resistance-associated protein 5-like isoform X1 [Lytechinus variegatus]XP_041482959.1 multidrug resistance-associated protein 5-like isoform X1 [Lytechinus variegatus]